MKLFFWLRKPKPQNPLVISRLFDEKNFYNTFIRDLEHVKKEVIIESPYITTKRMDILFPIFRKLVKKGINIYIIIRDPREHEGNMIQQAEYAIQEREDMGMKVFLCGGRFHRKIAILDREITWEGSLNILSHGFSREIMRRIQGKHQAKEMFYFLKLNLIFLEV